MEDKDMREQMEEVLNGLTDEQKEKAKSCKDMNELTALLIELGVALPDDALDAVAGGLLSPPSSGELERVDMMRRLNERMVEHGRKETGRTTERY